MPERVIVGISGASGAVLGIRTAEELASRGREVHAVVTAAALRVIRHEVGAQFSFPPKIIEHKIDDMKAPLYSSSFMADAMVVAPCSIKTLSAIASGYAENVLIRAADGMLRTGRKLVLVVRETPLSLSALENMASLKRGGAVLLPPCAAYYHLPKTVDDMTNFFVGKILDALGVANDLYERWGDG